MPTESYKSDRLLNRYNFARRFGGALLALSALVSSGCTSPAGQPILDSQPSVATDQKLQDNSQESTILSETNDKNDELMLEQAKRAVNETFIADYYKNNSKQNDEDAINPDSLSFIDEDHERHYRIIFELINKIEKIDSNNEQSVNLLIQQIDNYFKSIGVNYYFNDSSDVNKYATVATQADELSLKAQLGALKKVLTSIIKIPYALIKFSNLNTIRVVKDLSVNGIEPVGMAVTNKNTNERVIYLAEGFDVYVLIHELSHFIYKSMCNSNTKNCDITKYFSSLTNYDDNFAQYPRLLNPAEVDTSKMNTIEPYGLTNSTEDITINLEYIFRLMQMPDLDNPTIVNKFVYLLAWLEKVYPGYIAFYINSMQKNNIGQS